MSTTTSSQQDSPSASGVELLTVVNNLLNPKKTPLATAQERTIEWGGGLLAAVKAGAVQDHIHLLSDHEDQLDLDRKIASATIHGATRQELKTIVDDHWKANQDKEKEDDMGIHVQGDQTYNILGGGENLADIIKAIQSAQQQPTQPSLPPASPLVNTVNEPTKTTPVEKPVKQEESMPSLLYPIAAGLLTAVLGTGGLLGAANWYYNDSTAPAASSTDELQSPT